MAIKNNNGKGFIVETPDHVHLSGNLTTSIPTSSTSNLQQTNTTTEIDRTQKTTTPYGSRTMAMKDCTKSRLFKLGFSLSWLLPFAQGFSVQVSDANNVVARKDALREQASQVWKIVATVNPQERTGEILTACEGEIPDDLVGTYFVNGLASCHVFDRLVHPFESHGFFKTITFPGKARNKNNDENASDNEEKEQPNVARLQAKYVETPVRKLETIFRRPLFRGAMSSIADTSSIAGRILNALSPTDRDTANLAVRPWANKVLVTADNCPFYKVDPETLETLGIESFDGALDGEMMLAHTRVDSKRQRLIACSLEYDVPNQATKINFFEFDKDGRLISKAEHSQSPAFIFHDWMITENYYVVPAATAEFDLNKLPDLITGKSTATDIFAMDEKAPASVLLIPRDPSKGPAIEAKMSDGRHGVVFHMGPCHEEDDGSIVLYPMVFPRYQFGGEMGFLLHEQKFDPIPWSVSNGGPILEEWKVTLDPGTAGNGIIESKKLHEVPSDMPTFHPEREGKACRYLYTVCGVREEGWFPFNSIAKHDLKDGSFQIWPSEASDAVKGKADFDGGNQVWSEPLFVPRLDADSEDDGYVISTSHDASAKGTFLNIFDAKSFERGPVAVVDLGELWGWNIHSSFVSPASQST